MSDTYHGKVDDRRYTGDEVDITFSGKRCIHARFCVTRLAEVFDIDKRPWIHADGVSVDRVAEVIEMCPSGALHYERKDGKAGESTPTLNRIIVHQNEYIQFVGNLKLQGAQVDIQDETRTSLCRCGDSEKKPFCDNTHKKENFQTEQLEVVKVDDAAETGGELTVTAHENGPYEVVGNFQIENVAGQVIYTGSKTWLCRCGGSNKKPFCDGAHKENGFIAD